MRSTPLHPATAGLLIHANAIDNLISGRFNTEVSPALLAVLALIIAAVVGGIIHRMHSQWAAAAIAIAGVAMWIIAGYIALRGGIALNAVAAANSIALTYITITAVKFTAEQRHTAELRATFGRYVSPQILQHILAHPESVHLGGERRDLTILFSDIRGFTTIFRGQ